MSKLRLIFVTTLVLVISALGFASRRAGPPSVGELMHLAHNVGKYPWAIPAYIGLFVVASGVLAPAIVFFAVAGAAWGPGAGLSIGFVAVNLAANAQFALGRLLGRDAVNAWLERRGWHRLKNELQARGALSVVMVRQLPLPFVGVNVGFGASAVGWRQFAVGNALGVLPNLSIYTLLASTLANGGEGRATQYALVAAGAVVLLSLVLRWVAVRRNQATTPT
jgi:phospholipase D1/2